MADKAHGAITDKATPQSGDKFYLTDNADNLWRDMDYDDLKSAIVTITDPADASDTGTDVYQFDAGGDLSTGDVITLDIDSANTTSSPTAENTGGTPAGAQSIVDVDGNARIGMLEARPHRFQWDGTNFVVLDPASLYPTTASSDPSLSFGSWRTPNANRPTLVTVSVSVATDGTNTGQVNLESDESGGTTADYIIVVGRMPAGVAPGGGIVPFSVSILVPAGGSYRVVNTADPTTGNAIDDTREWTL